MKKILSFLALLILGLLTFTGCSVASTSATGVVTVSLSGWQSNPNEQKLLKQVLHDFETTHPGIRVKYEVINDQYMDVIKTRLIGDTAPDVFYLDAFEAPALMTHGVLEPLDHHMSADFDLADFQPRLLAAFKHDGKVYGFPKDFSPLALFYNQKAFRTAGLSQPPQTWDELRQFSKKLTVASSQDGKIEQYGFGITPELSRQAFMLQAFGGGIDDANGMAAFASPESLKGLQLIVDQYRRDRTSAQPSDVGTTSGGEIFGEGKAAMVIEGPWVIPYLKDTFPALEFGIAEVPRVNSKKGTMVYTVAYVVNKQSQHKTEALQLVSYLTSKQGMKAWTSQGFALPTRKSVTIALGYDKNPAYAPFITGAAYATVWQAGENLPTILNNFNDQFISALLGEQTLAAAMEKAQRTANKEIILAE